MKISIIGAGNMGGAIACGLAASGRFGAGDIVCSNPSSGKLERLRERYDIIDVTTDNAEAAARADVVVIAVKPWYVEAVVREIGEVFDPARQMLVSVVAGMSTARLAEWTGHKDKSPAVFQVIPNTAASIGKSMTFMSAANADAEQVAAVKSLFDTIGATMVVDEKMLDTGMILASCGIAFALGCSAAQATEIVARTMIGAGELLLRNGTHPEQEIDRVTTAGGITIRGLNEMEHAGFTSAVVRGLKACK